MVGEAYDTPRNTILKSQQRKPSFSSTALKNKERTHDLYFRTMFLFRCQESKSKDTKHLVLFFGSILENHMMGSFVEHLLQKKAAVQE